MVNSNYSALPLTSPAIELQSNNKPIAKSGAAAANGVVHNGHAKLTKQDSLLGEVEDDPEHDELPLMGGADGPAGPPEGSGVARAVFNLATSIIGAGIMALPATMKVLGVVVGLVSILVIGVLSEVTIELLVRFFARCRTLSYGELVNRALLALIYLGSTLIPNIWMAFKLLRKSTSRSGGPDSIHWIRSTRKTGRVNVETEK